LVSRLETWLATPSLETAWATSRLGLSPAPCDLEPPQATPIPASWLPAPGPLSWLLARSASLHVHSGGWRGKSGLAAAAFISLNVSSCHTGVERLSLPFQTAGSDGSITEGRAVSFHNNFVTCSGIGSSKLQSRE